MPTRLAIVTRYYSGTKAGAVNLGKPCPGRERKALEAASPPIPGDGRCAQHVRSGAW